MSHGQLPCPECQTMNAAPEEGTKKISCSSCGMILVLNKIYGEDWPAQAMKHGGSKSAPTKPKIVSRRTRGRRAKTEEPEPERKSKGTTRRGVRGGSRKAPTATADGESSDSGRRSTSRRKPATGMSPGMIYGSIGLIIVVGVILFFMVNNRNEEVARIESEKAAKEEQKKKDAAEKSAKDLAEIEASDLIGDGAVPDVPDEKPAAAKETKKKTAKKYPRRKRAPFETPSMTPEVAKAINDAIAVLQDPASTTGRRAAGEKLFEHRLESIPILINTLMAIDMFNEAECRSAYPLMEPLRMCSDFSTEYDRNLLVTSWPDNEKEVKSRGIEREIVVLDWWKWWNKNKDTWKPAVDSEEDF